MELKAVLFDLDGTLIDRKRSIDTFAEKWLRRYGSSLGSIGAVELSERIRRADGNGYRPKHEMFGELADTLSWMTPPSPEELRLFWEEQFPASSQLMDGAREVLDFLRSRGVLLGMITNGRSVIQHRKIERLGIRPLFQTIVISEEAGVKKPDERIFRLALDRLGVQPAEAWFVGDHFDNDVIGAARAGLTGIWLRGKADDGRDATPAADEAVKAGAADATATAAPSGGDGDAPQSRRADAAARPGGTNVEYRTISRLPQLLDEIAISGAQRGQESERMCEWLGAAAVCINDRRQLLMVLQGKPHEEKCWSVPSGGKEAGETLEECCAREVWEETGYRVNVGRRLFVKEGVTAGVRYRIPYYEVALAGGEPAIHDPDGLIYEVGWKSAEELQHLKLSFPEDREVLLRLLEGDNLPCNIR